VLDTRRTFPLVELTFDLVMKIVVETALDSSSISVHQNSMGSESESVNEKNPLKANKSIMPGKETTISPSPFSFPQQVF
jgi:hypothetical protein